MLKMIKSMKNFFIIFVSFVVLVIMLVGTIKFNSERIMNHDEGHSKYLMRQFPAPLNSFKRDIGRYPTNEEGLYVLQKQTDSIAGKWRGPYMPDWDLIDPWGNKILYKYSSDHDSYEIISAGPDGVFGTEDDIRYESKKK